MKKELLNCWEIMCCGREKGGEKTEKLGECIASKTKMGHSCWAIAGTLCKGKGMVQGCIAQKEGFCTSCKVYKLYNSATGTQNAEVLSNHPEEWAVYRTLMLKKNSCP